MISASARNLLLNWLLTAAAVVRPTTWYISLHTADPGTTGASEVLTATDASYIRKSAAFGAATTGVSSTTADVTWTAAAGATPYTVTHVGIWDALTGGNFILGGALAVPEPVVGSGSLALTAGRCIAALT